MSVSLFFFISFFFNLLYRLARLLSVIIYVYMRTVMSPQQIFKTGAGRPLVFDRREKKKKMIRQERRLEVEKFSS